MLRPPWALAEAQFLSQCDGCARCVKACDTHVIVLTNGFPRIDFQTGECTFCKHCAETCPTGALQRPEADLAPWTLKAQLDDRCLALQGVVCRSCGEQCETDAIRFCFTKGGVGQPQVNAAACTGCGACFAVCPAQAIALRDNAVYQEACA